ncbi:hypothetical protein D3C72_2063320 [compost metagenome]
MIIVRVRPLVAFIEDRDSQNLTAQFSYPAGAACDFSREAARIGAADYSKHALHPPISHLKQKAPVAIGIGGAGPTIRIGDEVVGHDQQGPVVAALQAQDSVIGQTL